MQYDQYEYKKTVSLLSSITHSFQAEIDLGVL